MGDSLTWGEGSSDGNGYRLVLANLVQANDYRISYIGRVKSGNMSNNENEGHRGFLINDVGLIGKPDYSGKPNIGLLWAGANDIIFDVDVINAPQRLGNLIGETVSACPDAVVLVATLLPLLAPHASNKTIDFNAAVTALVAEFEMKKEKVALVVMLRVSKTHIHASDGIHPTDEGYKLIAAAWHDGIVEAGGKGWIQSFASLPPKEQLVGNNTPTGHVPIGVFTSEAEATQTIEGTWISLAIYVLIMLFLMVGSWKALIFLIRRFKG